MDFSDVANKDGIIQNIEMVTEMKFGEITDNNSPDFLLNWFTVEINNWMHYVNTWIHQTNRQWLHDDGNNTGFPIETYDFTDDQEDYGIDSDIKGIIQVEIRDATTEKFSDVELMELVDRPQNRFGETKGNPTNYWFSGESIIFFPKPDITAFDKYRLTYNREASLFTISDTTKVPGFMATYHPILVYGPALIWASVKEKKNQNIIRICKEILYGNLDVGTIGLIKEMKKEYKRRAMEENDAIKRPKKSYA